ncbi:MAG TPA: glycerophosphodiester phosphodiesterase family protein [Ilumatobacter sp.]|nr:glycerophosphodiester phosphodiesterase family protein [Ilumatobacter sp.]
MRISAASLLATTVTAALVLAACGGSDDTAPTTTASTTGASVAVAPPPVPSTLSPATVPAPTASPATTPTTVAPTASPTTAAPTTATPTTAPAPAAPPTVDELLASGVVLNIAHAGGDQDHPHSTMYAFRQAVAAGADVLEMDVQLTGDGVLIVQHDADTVKTTEADLEVGETDLATLQALDNAYWFSPQCWPCHDLATDAYTFRGIRTGDVAPPDGFTPDDFRIITLAELSAAFPSLPFDIEIKGSGAAGLAVAAALATELVALDRLDSTVVASFDSEVIGAFHELAPSVDVSPGVTEMAAWLLGGAPLPEHYRIVQIPPFYDDIEVLSPANLETAAAAGVTIWVWPNDASTQENEDYYRELVAMGVGGIIAGRPAAATAAIG